MDQRGYPYSPVDHTISKAVYFEDLEGITVEFTLETLGREDLTTQGGQQSGGPKPLNVSEILRSLKDDDVEKIIDDESFIGHIHLYANNLEKSNEFYQKIGFISNKYKPQMVFADVSADGEFGHRIAMNSWHGRNRPLAPKDVAGLDHFQLVYKDKDQLSKIVNTLENVNKTIEGYWIEDPTGNKILLN